MLRARRAEDKEVRRRAFLDAVRTLFARGSFASVTMADVAREAGLAKGTVFLYFPTKEALFLELLNDECNGWLDEMDVALGATGEVKSAEQIAELFATSLSSRLALTRILSLVSGVLEHNIEVERVQQFKLALFKRMARTGSLLERHLGIRPGAGVRTLLRLYALIVGLRTLAEPGPVAAQAMQHPELSVFVIDFNEEMREILIALFRMAVTT